MLIKVVYFLFEKTYVENFENSVFKTSIGEFPVLKSEC